MYLTAGALVGIAGVSGLVITPIVWGGISKPTRKVFLIAESASKKTKLFLEEEKRSKPQEKSKVTLKAIFDRKDISGSFLLCSPSGNKEDYYLLKWNDSWKNNLDPNNSKAIPDCNEKSSQNMGEKLVDLNIKPDESSGTSALFKEVDLRNCEIQDLRKEESQINSNLFKLTCGEVWGKTNKKIEIFSTSYVNI